MEPSSTEEILRNVRRIELSARKLVHEKLAGQYQSVFKGQGMEFSEVREYFPGDEVRNIDWNVSARMNKAHIKVFSEERELNVLLVVDISGSMDLNTHKGSKRWMAAQVAAVLALSSIVNGDRVGLLLFSDKLEHYLPPKKGRMHVLRIIRELLYFRPISLNTDVQVGFRCLRRIGNRRSLCFVLSDFMDPQIDSQGGKKELQLCLRRHEIVPIVLSDPMEIRLPSLGLVTFRDLESGERLEVHLDSDNADRFREAVISARKARLRPFIELGMEFIDLGCGRSYVESLLRFFRQRNYLRVR